jgi:hypothetical protein
MADEKGYGRLKDQKIARSFVPNAGLVLLLSKERCNSRGSSEQVSSQLDSSRFAAGSTELPRGDRGDFNAELVSFDAVEWTM